MKIITEKECTVCKKTLPIGQFRLYQARNRNFKRRRACKGCERKSSRERYRKQKAQSSIEQDDTIRLTNYYRKIKGDLRNEE